MISSEEKAAIRQRCDAATPGEWMAKNKSVRTLKSDGEERPWNTAPTGGDGGICNCLGGNSYATKKSDPINHQAIRNADFIANAREDVPRLLDEIDTLTAELAQTQKERDDALRWVIDKCANCAKNTTCNHEKAEGWQRNYKTCEDWQWRGLAVDGEDVNGLEKYER